ncbi:asparagine synthase [Altererythrobacter sp. B11]|nr:asparagine synthase [Altererythrobacter sp. B11]
MAGLDSQYNEDGFFVATDQDCDLHMLGEGAGCVIGTLFHRFGAPTRVERLEASESALIATTNAKHLIERFWGRYIAILRLDHGKMALRDPSGMLSCVYVIREGLLALASEPSLLVDAGLLEPIIDNCGLARGLLLAGFPDEQTSLQGLKYLRPGTAILQSEYDTITQVEWNPSSYIVSQFPDDPDREAELLQRATQQSISAWSGRYKRGLACVSGGLDSSAVASGLARAGNELSCLTLATDDPIGDEREYSRILARHLGVHLVEAHYDLRDVNLDVSSVKNQARPFGRLDSLSYDAALVRAARSVGATAAFSGLGGDNVFFMSHSARPLVDRYLAQGISLGLWETATDLCRLTGESIFKVTREAVRNWNARRRGYNWRLTASHLSVDAIQSQLERPVDHPWLPAEGTHVPPGKAAQIAMLLRLHHSLDAYSERGGVPVIHPLASQPVLESCLRIPSWHQCRGGVDRAIARLAFQSHLPAEIVNRRLKGSPQGFVHTIYRQLSGEIKERLLDGYLVSSGIVDASSLEKAMAMGPNLRGVDILRLLLFVDTEAWITHWRTMRASLTN